MNQAGQDQSFPVRNRVRKRWEYRRAGKSRLSVGDKYMRVVLAPRNKKRQGPTRLGTVVSTKVSKKAVVRHALKRWMREYFRVYLKEMFSGVDIIIHARPAAAQISHHDFIKRLAAHCQQLQERLGSGSDNK